MIHKSSGAALLAGAAVSLTLAMTPALAADEQAVVASVDRVFSDYGPVQREAILHQVWTESGGKPCVVSRTADEGLFQEHGERRVDMHRFAGVPMGQCVPVLAQVEFARIEWEARPQALAAFARARSEPVAYAIFRGVHGKGLSLAEALRASWRM